MPELKHEKAVNGSELTYGLRWSKEMLIKDRKCIKWFSRIRNRRPQENSLLKIRSFKNYHFTHMILPVRTQRLWDMPYEVNFISTIHIINLSVASRLRKKDEDSPQSNCHPKLRKYVLHKHTNKASNMPYGDIL